MMMMMMMLMMMMMMMAMMAIAVSQGRHSNGSQFYITLQPTSWMDTNYVAFGKLVEGGALLDRWGLGSWPYFMGYPRGSKEYRN
jgi:cyclophilin family peptidyl-prolyl cis-trans isomerase